MVLESIGWGVISSRYREELIDKCLERLNENPLRDQWSIPMREWEIDFRPIGLTNGNNPACAIFAIPQSQELQRKVDSAEKKLIYDHEL